MASLHHSSWAAKIFIIAYWDLAKLYDFFMVSG
jgi:hypothetical protein